jgi:DNA-binding transcriptional regulator LsrR (DeoR family)
MTTMRKHRGRGSRRPISDETAVEITLARFASHPLRTIETLAADFNRDPAVISRTITRAFRNGLVEVRPARQSTRPVRKERLERQLHERYEQLSTCVVLECDQPTTPAADDLLHSNLGAAMASLIGSGSVFRNGDAVGIGSGRAVFYTIQHLSAFSALRARVSLCSLTGHVQPRDHAEQLNLLLDADIHLGLLGLCFSRPVRLYPLGQGLACRTPDEVESAIAHSRLSEGEWKHQPFTHALLGVGVLGPGHRFYNQIKGDDGRRSRLLLPIQEPLTQLIRICDEFVSDHGPLHSPVADMSNRLFFVPFPPSLGLTSGVKRLLEKKLTALISEINAHLVTATEAQLRSTGQIMLVAGSRQKSLAVKSLLMQRYPIRVLCVDHHLASDLLA